MYTVCFTGHRKMSGEYYNHMNPTAEWMMLKNYLYKIVLSFVEDHNVTHFISGLAIGVDTVGAETVNHCRATTNTPIKLTGAMPFPAQASSWPAPSRNHWQDLLLMCDESIAVSDNPYHPSKMQTRNEWMVDNSNYTIAVWDGRKKGGTWNCVKYALSKDVPVLHVHKTHQRWEHTWLTPGA